MKVAVISTPIFRLPCVGYAGLEHLAWLTARGLAAKGHQVSLVAPTGSGCPGVAIIPIGEERTVSERDAYSSYWQHLLEVDAVVEHSWGKWAYILKQEGRLKAPVLGVCHAPVNTMFASLPPGVEKPCFVCISEDQGLHFRGLYGRDCRVAYNGVDPDQYRPLGLPRSDRFLFLARFSSVKSPLTNMEVCQEAGAGLDMVGDTSITSEPELLRQCQQRADGRQVRILGPCSRGESIYWFSQARGLMHLCLTYREPFGLSPVEAMLCGCPVLAWRYGAMPETVRHGETGFLVASQREAVEVVRSGALDGLDRNRCREWASQFSVERMVNRYDELVREAVEGGGW
jgi:glycosyltransferase involved in cell wall biosynthesis